MSWYMWAILYSMAFAGYYGVNQQFKIRPEALVVWSGFGTAFLFLPMLLNQKAPLNSEFYVYAVISGLLATFLDNRNFTLTSKYGAGVITRMAPLCTGLVCILWWVIKPEIFWTVFNNKPVFFGICLCLSLCIVAGMMMKKDNVSNDAMKEYAWVVLASAIYIVMVKQTMNSAINAAAGAMYFMIIEVLISGCINGGIGCKSMSIKEFKKVVFNKTSLKAGIFIIFFISSLCMTRNRAMNLSFNPAYVDAIGRGAPFLWILLFNKIKGVQDKTNLKAGILFVVSAVGIILLSSK